MVFSSEKQIIVILSGTKDQHLSRHNATHFLIPFDVYCRRATQIPEFYEIEFNCPVIVAIYLGSILNLA